MAKSKAQRAARAKKLAQRRAKAGPNATNATLQAAAKKKKASEEPKKKKKPKKKSKGK